MLRVTVLALALAGQVEASHTKHCTLLTNNFNTEYTAEIHVGTPLQTMRVVPDTGSSDLLLDSTACVDCGGKHFAFDAKKSTTFKGPNGMTAVAYGQGEVLCELGKDHVTVAGAETEKADLLLMTVNAIQGFNESPYDGVMGLGPHTSDGDGTGVSLLTHLGMNEFSICFGHEEGSKGRLHLGNGIAGGAEYMSMTAQGTNYWGAFLTSMKVNGKSVSSKCAPHCAAIVDSGTSLIGLPTAVHTEITKKIGHVAKDCSNRESLPNINLQLGGHTLELEAKHYVVRTLDTDLATSGNSTTMASVLEDSPFGISHLAPSAQGVKEACVAGFFAMDEPTNEGPMIILGIPFLRAYAAKFSRGNGDGSRSIAFSKVTSATMCTECGGSGDHDEHEMIAKAKKKPNVLLPGSDAVHAAVGIPMNKLRLPWWIRHHNSTKHRDEFGRHIL